MKTALISGVTGQDGYFLAKFLIEKGYTVYGLIRRSSQNALDLFNPSIKDLKLRYADLQDAGSLLDVILEANPDEVYNLAAQSHVGISFKQPEYTADVTGLGALRMLEACHKAESLLHKKIRFYQASSSEMYGKVQAVPQTETTPFYPRSPYACAKAFAHFATVNYRESYNMHASCGILFNHESEERGDDFVTRKITKAIARMAHGSREVLWLGNLDAQRDWGYAKDYVEAMWLMLQQPKPDDYVIATGQTQTVRDFVEESFRYLKVEIYWCGAGVNEHARIRSLGIDSPFRSCFKSEDIVVLVSADFYRPAEVNALVGDYSKAAKVLGWKPKTNFSQLVEIMVKSDYMRFEKKSQDRKWNG